MYINYKNQIRQTIFTSSFGDVDFTLSTKQLYYYIDSSTLVII